MRRLKRLWIGMVRVAGRGLDVLRGKRYYSFYFSTVSIADSVLAIGYAGMSLLLLPGTRGGRERLAAAVRARYGGEAFFYGSARSALYDHLGSLQLPDGAEVVVTGFTCEVVANAVVQAGLRPVYADIDPLTYCMDPGSVRQVVTDNTAVLVIQHTFGIPAAMDELLQIARERDLYVIEDCAVALGTTHRGQLAGTFGDAAIFSFELSKTITSCRGGMLVLHRTDRALDRQRTRYADVPEPTPWQTASVLFQLGASGLLYRPGVYPIGELVAGVLLKVGIFQPSTTKVETEGRRSRNYLVRLSHGQAALLLRQWRQMPEVFSRARELTARYRGALAEKGWETRGVTSAEACLVRYPLRRSRRDRLRDRLRRQGVEMGYWFTAPLSSPSVDHERLGYVDGMCVTAEEVARDVMNLPTHPRITDEVSRIIIEAIEAHDDE
jgi:perosamine synthetase